MEYLIKQHKAQLASDRTSRQSSLSEGIGANRFVAEAGDGQLDRGEPFKRNRANLENLVKS